jgi:hypothetical protein
MSTTPPMSTTPAATPPAIGPTLLDLLPPLDDPVESAPGVADGMSVVHEELVVASPGGAFVFGVAEGKIEVVDREAAERDAEKEEAEAEREEAEAREADEEETAADELLMAARAKALA